jgi:hypothetical protein
LSFLFTHSACANANALPRLPIFNVVIGQHFR